MNTLTNSNADFLVFDKLFRLDPETGFIFWKVGGRGRGIGKRAGGYKSNSLNEYRRVWIDGKLFYEHRIIWLLTHGQWPTKNIDHDNRDKGFNKPSNLLDVTQSQNLLNASTRIDNTSGFKGVDQTESGNWRARKRRKQLGTFATKQEAINAYRSAL